MQFLAGTVNVLAVISKFEDFQAYISYIHEYTHALKDTHMYSVQNPATATAGGIKNTQPDGPEALQLTRGRNGSENMLLGGGEKRSMRNEVGLAGA